MPLRAPGLGAFTRPIERAIKISMNATLGRHGKFWTAPPPARHRRARARFYPPTPAKWSLTFDLEHFGADPVEEHG